MRDARGMPNARKPGSSLPAGNPGDLRARLEAARLDLLALFRALDRMHLSSAEIPQGLLRQLFERDADFAEALWALDQVEGSFDRRAMLRDTLTALDQLPSAAARFRNQLPARVHTTLERLERGIRQVLNLKEAYTMVPGRDPDNV
jgi:hypothetical protein